MSWWARLKHVVVNRILGLRDTPHRIAWGVFLGFVVAFSPTVGLQMLIYVAVATLLRANKVAGIPIVWITNPATVAPIYYACWWLGAFVLGTNDDPERGERTLERLRGNEAGFTMSRLLETEFWSEVFAALWSLGAELWLGGLIVGLVFGAIAYPLTIWGVRLTRRRT